MPVDVAPIAEDFIQRLLHETDAIEAVHMLADRWSVRTRPNEPWFGLSRPEHQTSMVLIYTGEVGNGGHTQFFSNRGGDITARVRVALREIGFDELDGILSAACALFPDGEVPTSRDEVDTLLDSFGDDRHAELDRLDKLAWKQRVEDRLLAYLREHDSEVLRAERGLDGSC